MVSKPIFSTLLQTQLELCVFLTKKCAPHYYTEKMVAQNRRRTLMLKRKLPEICKIIKLLIDIKFYKQRIHTSIQKRRNKLSGLVVGHEFKSMAESCLRL